MSTESLSDLPSAYLNENIGARLIRVAVAFIVLEFIFVTLRYYSRYTIKTRVGLDDVLITPALIICLCLNSLAIAMVKYGGVGRHLPALAVLDPIRITYWAKMLLAAEWLYLIAVTLPKLCVLSVYLRIFTTKSYRRAVYILAAIITLNAVAGCLTGTLACQPLNYTWDKTIPGGHCININAFYRWISLPNILTDLAMLILPIPLVWSLHTSTSRKIGLTITFLTGSLGFITAIVRFVNFFIHDAISDGTYASVDLLTWTIIEPGIYLVAACLPALRPLLQDIVEKASFPTLGSKRVHKYGDVSAESSARNIQLLGGKGPGSKGGQAEAGLAGFQRINGPKESLDEITSAGDERKLGAYDGSETDNSYCSAGRGSLRRTEPTEHNGIRIEHDFQVTTSESRGPGKQDR